MLGIAQSLKDRLACHLEGHEHKAEEVDVQCPHAGGDGGGVIAEDAEKEM